MVGNIQAVELEAPTFYLSETVRLPSNHTVTIRCSMVLPPIQLNLSLQTSQILHHHLHLNLPKPCHSLLTRPPLEEHTISASDLLLEEILPLQSTTVFSEIQSQVRLPSNLLLRPLPLLLVDQVVDLQLQLPLLSSLAPLLQVLLDLREVAAATVLIEGLKEATQISRE